jgi:hypothetical protein
MKAPHEIENEWIGFLDTTPEKEEIVVWLFRREELLGVG